jgi:hypothetical protein
MSFPDPTSPAPTARDRLLAAGRAARESALALPEALVDAVASLYDHALDRVLVSPVRVTSAAEGRRRLAEDDDTEALADNVQRVVVVATPVVRTFVRSARLTRVPWVLVASSATSIAVSVRAGVREVQVLGSLVAHRIERETGLPADPALVKKLTVELYLAPKKAPDLRDRRLRIPRLVRRWVVSGALGLGTSKAAPRALDAAERLDVQAALRRWEAVPPRRQLPPGPPPVGRASSGGPSSGSSPRPR